MSPHIDKFVFVFRKKLKKKSYFALVGDGLNDIASVNISPVTVRDTIYTWDAQPADSEANSRTLLVVEAKRKTKKKKKDGKGKDKKKGKKYKTSTDEITVTVTNESGETSDAATGKVVIVNEELPS